MGVGQWAGAGTRRQECCNLSGNKALVRFELLLRFMVQNALFLVLYKDMCVDVCTRILKKQEDWTRFCGYRITRVNSDGGRLTWNQARHTREAQLPSQQLILKLPNSPSIHPLRPTTKQLSTLPPRSSWNVKGRGRLYMLRGTRLVEGIKSEFHLPRLFGILKPCSLNIKPPRIYKPWF